MKKIIALFSLVALLGACNQNKLAYVDLEEVLEEYKAMTDAQKELEQRELEFKKELDQLAVTYQSGLKEYQDKGRSMSTQKRQETENLLLQQQQRLNQQQQQAQQRLQKFGQEKNG